METTRHPSRTTRSLAFACLGAAGLLAGRAGHARAAEPPVWRVDLAQVHHPFKGVGWNVQTAHFTADSPLYGLLDDTAPQFIRAVGWLPDYYQPGENRKTYESDRCERIYRFVKYCNDKNIWLLMANWNCGGRWDDLDYCWLADACRLPPGVPERPAEFDWPETWTVFGPFPKGSPPAAADELRRMPERLTIAGAARPPRPLKAAEGLLDFAAFYGDKESRGGEGREAYACAEIRCVREGRLTIGAGADWRMQWYLDGQPLYGTVDRICGNRHQPCSVNDYVFSTALSAGKHVLAVRVLAGGRGWKLAACGGAAHENRLRDAETGYFKIKRHYQDHPYSARAFASTLVDHLAYMTTKKGLRLDGLSLWNEPNGTSWSYHPLDNRKRYPDSFTPLVKSVRAELDSQKLDGIALVGLEHAYTRGKLWPNEVAQLEALIAQWGPSLQAYSLHPYNGPTDASLNFAKFMFDRAGGKPVIMGETGTKASVGGRGIDEAEGAVNTATNRWDNSLLTAVSTIADVRLGAYASARWWFNGLARDERWTAVPGPDLRPVPETYNGIKILANTLPQTRTDLSVLRMLPPAPDRPADARALGMGPHGQGVAINAGRAGEENLVLWVANAAAEAYRFDLDARGLPAGPLRVVRKVLTGRPPYRIETLEPQEIERADAAARLGFSVPGNTIFTAEIGAAR